jgi:hypothetical protein
MIPSLIVLLVFLTLLLAGHFWYLELLLFDFDLGLCHFARLESLESSNAVHPTFFQLFVFSQGQFANYINSH